VPDLHGRQSRHPHGKAHVGQAVTAAHADHTPDDQGQKSSDGGRQDRQHHAGSDSDSSGYMVLVNSSIC
jgi:hypothetical protein